MIKLSLGCGKVEDPDYIGLDNTDFGWNKIWDGTRDALPFPDQAVDYIKMENFIEHIERRYWRFLLNECWRVLKPNGILYFTAPNASKSIDIALADPTHVSLFVKGSLKYFSGERPRNADYGFKRWQIISCEDDPKDERILNINLRPNK